MSNTKAKPFVTWVGGKRELLSEIRKRTIPFEKENGFTGTYYEPFLGGGSLFFDLQPKDAVLSDKNLHLINAYWAVQNDVEGLIDELTELFEEHSKETYREIRKTMNKAYHEMRHAFDNYSEKEIRREVTQAKITSFAAEFMYLNRTCFNGLFRVNKKGDFNVPMGTHRPLVNEDNLKRCSEALKDADIRVGNFMGIERVPTMKGDFFFLDPPYHGKYSGYGSDGFRKEDHVMLKILCDQITKRGGYFLLCNSDEKFILDLYKSYTIEVVERQQTIAGKNEGRGAVRELLVSNYKPYDVMKKYDQ